MNFSEEQEKAIKALEKAFKKASEAGLYVVGINSRLKISNYPFYRYNRSKQLKEIVELGIELNDNEVYTGSYEAEILRKEKEDGTIEFIYTGEKTD